jgi:hypothetical protein
LLQLTLLLPHAQVLLLLPLDVRECWNSMKGRDCFLMCQHAVFDA